MQNQLQSLTLTLLNIGYANLDNKWDFDNVISPFTRLYLITEGSARVYHNNMKFDLKPGFMYLIPSYTYSRYKCDDYHEQYYISFIEEFGSGMSAYDFEDFNYEIKATESDEYYFRRLLEINQNRALLNNDPEVYDNKPVLYGFGKRNEQLPAKYYMETMGILKILFSKFIKNETLKKEKSTESNLKKVLIHISENLQENLTIENLAIFCNLSKDHFSRSFYKNTGIRPNKYIQSKRVERAQLLLLTTNHSLLEIAIKVGFENASYFSKIFKKFTGRTPGCFRREQLSV